MVSQKLKTMKTNKDLINKLKNGEIAINNQGNPNVELLRAVLKEAFPLCSSNAVGDCNKYGKNRNGKDWTSIFVDLPTIPLNDFLEREVKYTVEYCKNNNVAIRFNTKEEGNRIVKLFKFDAKTHPL